MRKIRASVVERLEKAKDKAREKSEEKLQSERQKGLQQH